LFDVERFDVKPNQPITPTAKSSHLVNPIREAAHHRFPQIIPFFQPNSRSYVQSFPSHQINPRVLICYPRPPLTKSSQLFKPIREAACDRFSPIRGNNTSHGMCVGGLVLVRKSQKPANLQVILSQHLIPVTPINYSIKEPLSMPFTSIIVSGRLGRPRLVAGSPSSAREAELKDAGCPPSSLPSPQGSRFPGRGWTGQQGAAPRSPSRMRVGLAGECDSGIETRCLGPAVGGSAGYGERFRVASSSASLKIRAGSSERRTERARATACVTPERVR
jgi:hypothetical protein